MACERHQVGALSVTWVRPEHNRAAYRGVASKHEDEVDYACRRHRARALENGGERRLGSQDEK